MINIMAFHYVTIWAIFVWRIKAGLILSDGKELSDYMDGKELIINNEELTSASLIDLNISSVCCLTSVDMSYNNLSYFPELLGSKG